MGFWWVAHRWSCRVGKGQSQQTSINWFEALNAERKINLSVLFCRRKCLKELTLLSKLSTAEFAFVLFQWGVIISLELSVEEKWLTTVIAYVNDSSKDYNNLKTRDISRQRRAQAMSIESKAKKTQPKTPNNKITQQLPQKTSPENKNNGCFQIKRPLLCWWFPLWLCSDSIIKLP